MQAYITGAGAVTPQDTFEPDRFFENLTPASGDHFEILKPDYKKFIPAKNLRRMSKIVRMGVVAAKTALEDAAVEQPDAIITGTGMGSQKDTEKFLNGMIDNKETLANPTAFMQSTHNTVGAVIALGLGNNNYNFTYVHRTFSLESALLDAMMLLENREAEHVLVGGVDELTEENLRIKRNIGYYKKEPLGKGGLLEDNQQGAFPGEGASFFVLSAKPGKKNYGKIKAVKTFINRSEKGLTEKLIGVFLSENGFNQTNGSSFSSNLVLLGYNGDPVFDRYYDDLGNSVFNSRNIGYFKHLCGEYDTASGFALYLSAQMMHRQHIPQVCIKQQAGYSDRVDKILIYNHFRNYNHSLILLER